ncbi:hypothetical protein ACFFLS_11800 [Flavobacterium procerum]|uniref:SMODS-associating 2TM beta-strand rich effector domain-containing protein n=1 Tax=Flavobacterium procerum TaxID=1455569 RepID=A0ABV6BUN4_9FLAO
MKLFIKMLLLTIFDFIVIWFWVKENAPDSNVSIAIILVVPAVIIINLVVAFVLYFIIKEYSKIFVINSFISAVLMYFLFTNGIDRHQKKIAESWKFNIKDTVFVITHWKLENTFSISESTNPGSSTSFLDGKFSKKGNGYYLTTDSKKYHMRNEYLHGFRSETDSIKLTKIEK